MVLEKGSKALFATVLVKNIIAPRYYGPTPDLKQVDRNLHNRYSLLQSVHYAGHRAVFSDASLMMTFHKIIGIAEQAVRADNEV